MKPTLTILVASAFFASACAVELDLGSTSGEGKMLNGKMLNGKMLNGTGLFVTAAYPNPGTYEGVALPGTYRNGSQVKDVYLKGTRLVGHQNGRWISDTEFEGATIPGLDSDGSPLRLRIEKVVSHSSGLYFYDVLAITSSSKEPLCVDDKGNRLLAIPISGIWDHHQGNPGDGGKIPDTHKYGITFGCREIGATAKCVELGYWPWLSDDHDLAHQSCVRMVRADYCGDGRSWTYDGTLIDIEDEIPEQLFAMYDPSIEQKDWMFEATWSPNGATCIENVRYSNNHPWLNTSLAEEVERGTCPNAPNPVLDKEAARFLMEYPAGKREGQSLCGWEPPPCDPSVQTCFGDKGVDYYGFTTANAKGPGTW